MPSAICYISLFFPRLFCFCISCLLFTSSLDVCPRAPMYVCMYFVVLIANLCVCMCVYDCWLNCLPLRVLLLLVPVVTFFLSLVFITCTSFHCLFLLNCSFFLPICLFATHYRLCRANLYSHRCKHIIYYLFLRKECTKKINWLLNSCLIMYISLFVVVVGYNFYMNRYENRVHKYSCSIV